MTSKCRTCHREFNVTAAESSFLKRVSPVVNSSFLEIAAPSLCPECRRRRRLAFRNERNLYRRTSSLSGTQLLSVYSPDKKAVVYSAEEWWGDRWDPTDYARDFDPKRPFFAQLAELRSAVPTKALSVVNCENCEYNNHLINSRNCYLVFGSANCEDCFHVNGSINIKDSADVWWSNTIELSAGIYCSDFLHHCLFCDRCSNSQNLTFCRDCDGCSDCYGCCGLVHKQYCIFNRQYSQAEYQLHIGQVDCGSYGHVEALRKQVDEFYLTQAYRAVESFSSENCSGDIMIRSRNCDSCFTIVECEDGSHLSQCGRLKDGHDLDFVYDCPGFIYEAIDCTGLFNCAFVWGSNNCSDSYYLNECFNLKNCFGCVGLRDKRFCILNRQYTKDEYYQLLRTIHATMVRTGEWGEFPSLNYSSFGYNETVAANRFPLDRKQVEALGARWSDYERPAPQATKILAAEEIPDHISQILDSIVDAAIRCEVSGRLFRIPRAELDLYRRLKLMLPSKHPDVRYDEMLSLLNPQQLFARTCSSCKRSIQSTYAPTRPERIVCEKCYIEEVRG